MPKNIRIIYFAFLFSCLVYTLIGFFLWQSGWTPTLSDVAVRRIVIYVLAAAAVGVVFVVYTLRMKFFPSKRDVAEAENPRSGSRYIALFALAEVPAILGLVGFFFTGSLLSLLVLSAISLLCYALILPSEGTV